MTLNPIVRRLLLGLAVLVLLGLAWTGLAGGLHQLRESDCSGQKVQTFAQVGYGLLGVLVIATTFWARRASPVVQIAWIISVALAGGLAPVVWGGTAWRVGFLAGGAALVIGIGTVWLLRVGARGLTGA